MNYKLKVSLASATGIIISLLILAWFIGPSIQDRALTFAFIASGSAIGWLLGILASPYDRVEKSHFAVIAKGISLFLSGYLLAKIDHLVDELVAPALLFQPIAGFRALACFSSIVVITIVTFVFRQYSEADKR